MDESFAWRNRGGVTDAAQPTVVNDRSDSRSVMSGATIPISMTDLLLDGALTRFVIAISTRTM
jgi:hypothetical protein